MLKLSAFLLLLIFSVADANAQNRSVGVNTLDSKVAIDKYKQDIELIKNDLSVYANELSNIVKCYRQGKIYGSTIDIISGTYCKNAGVHSPETDPEQANHANNSIPLSCANNQVQRYFGGSWNCKTIRYLCSNPSGC